MSAGDVVAAKKPDPSVYGLAVTQLNAVPARTVAVEDSRHGLLAAKPAGLRCIVKPSAYTAGEDFWEADLLVADLDDRPLGQVTLADCRALCADG